MATIVEVLVRRLATTAVRVATLLENARENASRARTDKSSTTQGLSTGVASIAAEWVISLQIVPSLLVTRRVTTAVKRDTLPRIVLIPRLSKLRQL